MFTQFSLRNIINYFNKISDFPRGTLLTLSRYGVTFSASDFLEACKACSWEIKKEVLTHRTTPFSAKHVFLCLGFDHIETMDYSQYEGADLIYDLNQVNVPIDLAHRYDFILDAGTIEHVFHFPNVLENIYRFLKPNGTFIFDQPSFYGITHGFYNFSPAVYYEYFLVNNYRINSFISYALLNGQMVIEIENETDFRYGKVKYIKDASCHMIWGAVSKTPESTYGVVPYQQYYAKQWEQSALNIEQLCNIIDKTVGNGCVYLYGTGTHTTQLLEALGQEYLSKITGLLTKDPDRVDWRDYPIKPGDIGKLTAGDTVIISSRFYQDIIYERINYLTAQNVEIVRLYT